MGVSGSHYEISFVTYQKRVSTLNGAIMGGSSHYEISLIVLQKLVVVGNESNLNINS